MKNPVRSVIVFFAMTMMIAWILWAPACLSPDSSGKKSLYTSILISAGSFSPLIASLVMVWQEERMPGIKKFLKKGISFRMSGLSWLYLIMIPFSAAAAAIIGQTKCSMKGSFSLLEHPQYIIPVFVVLMLFGGPAGGEFGWRGYALEKMNAVMDPFFSSIAISVMWCVWQLPLFIVPGTVQNGTTPGTFFIISLLVSILMTVLYLRSGSVGWAIVQHSLVNLSFGIFSIYVSNCRTVYFIFILSIITGIAVIFEHRRMFPSELKKIR